MTDPPRGFPPDEFAGRLTRARTLMDRAGLDALLLTTEPEIRYFTGFLTRFWESPTRPWFLVVPAVAPPVAVIPQIGASLMARAWDGEIRSWPAPAPDDDGVSLLADTLRQTVPAYGAIGVPDGPETRLRMPLADWTRLATMLERRRVAGDAGIMRRLRLVKSAREIDKIAAACAIAGRAFARLGEIVAPGAPLAAVFRDFQALCLHEGADWVAYLAGAAGPDGYGDVISPATGDPLATGDIVMLDTGVVHDGYFCDFDRNVAIGRATAAARNAHERLIEATRAGFEATRPGATAADLFAAMDRVLTGGRGGAGRLGHGLGMQLTEWPSLQPGDATRLEPGMVLTLEPCVALGDGRIMVHEENIAITADGARWLTDPAADELRIV